MRTRFLSGSNWTQHCAKEINEHGSLSEFTVYVRSLMRKKRSTHFIRTKTIQINITSQCSESKSLSVDSGRKDHNLCEKRKKVGKEERGEERKEASSV